MLPDLAELADLVRTAAREELLPRFTRVTQRYKADGSVLTEADLAIDARLRDELARRWPAAAFVSEEMERAEQERRLQTAGSLLWCLDPLDGTSNFAAGIPFFGVSLALLEDGVQRLGLIYDPVRDECFLARRDGGASLNGMALRSVPASMELGRSIALVDFKRLEPALRMRLVSHPPYHSQRNLGSCALEWAWLAAGRGQVYLHGGQKLWDFAAGSLLLDEAGGASCTLSGEAVFIPCLAARSVVASPDPELAAHWLGWLQGAGRDG